MALVPCVECGNQISDQAKTCPHCGIELIAKQATPPPIRVPVSTPPSPAKPETHWGKTILIIGSIFFIIWIYNSLPEITPPIAVQKPIVTMAEYNQLSTGMSYSQVCRIIGASGVEDSRNTIEGVPGVMESIETVMYTWSNPGYSNMNAMFQNDKLISKAQFGLE